MSILKKSLLMSTALLWGVQGTWAMFTEGYLDDQRAIPSSQSSPLGKRKEIEAEKESSHLQFGEEVNAKIPSIVTAQIQHVGLERIAHDIIFHGLNFKTEQREGFLQHHQIYPYIERTTQQFIRDALLGSIPEVFPNNEEERKLTHKDGNEGAMVRASFYNVLGDGDCLLYVLG
ncbi:MAG: hypothetical protein K2P93_06740, partial [Alphaproteobacteria bacterium]|nr:hypothetical protein [Alphaproteobacteria bacterium]